MLGAVHAFLDEVFDGRDMLLRSILNVLHERELKHGRKVTPGRCECAVMTSNRYLSEVVARSPETLQAFADRIAFICFTPKSFARRASRAQMLTRAQTGERPDLRERLTLQQLDELQDLVTRVEVPPLVAEGLEQLADTLEKELLTQVVKLPDYVPTKYFSQRSMVKALWALKAVVVRDRIYRRPERRLVAELSDLETLRYYFLLGGPPTSEVDVLLKAAVDPRERAQLEIIRVENKAFDDALKALGPSLERAAQREGEELQTKQELAASESLGREWTATVASQVARALREKLVPGPRHPENRAPLLRAAGQVALALESRVGRGLGEGRAGEALLGSVLEAFDLTRRVPELEARVPAVAGAVLEFCRQAVQMVSLTAEGTEFEKSLKLEDVASLAQSLTAELTRIIELTQTAGLFATAVAGPVRQDVAASRERVAAALRRRAARTFDVPRRPGGDPLELLTSDSRRLRELEQALAELSANHRGLRLELLTPLGETYARETVGTLVVTRIEQLTRALQPVIDNLRREGASVTPAVRAVAPLVETRVREYVQKLQPPRAPTPEGAQAFSGEAYTAYRQSVAAQTPDGEAAALTALSTLLQSNGAPALPGELRDQLATAELASLITRVRYLRTWLSQVLGSLPVPEEIGSRADADKAFDLLVKSRFPTLVTREGELVRLEASLRRLSGEVGERGDAVGKLTATLATISTDFTDYGRRLLDLRSLK